MNIKLYKEECFFVALSILVLGVAVVMGNYGLDIGRWQEHLVAVLDFIANETPHS